MAHAGKRTGCATPALHESTYQYKSRLDSLLPHRLQVTNMAFRPGLLYALLRIVVWLVIGAATASGQSHSGLVSRALRFLACHTTADISTNSVLVLCERLCPWARLCGRVLSIVSPVAVLANISMTVTGCSFNPETHPKASAELQNDVPLQHVLHRITSIVGSMPYWRSIMDVGGLRTC